MPPSSSAAAAPAAIGGRSMTTAEVGKTTMALPSTDMTILDDVADLKWKIYGKNMYFSILFEATVKIQAYWRGALARAQTAQRIEEMIDRILTTRQQAAKDAEEWERYRQQDLLERRQRQQEQLDGDDDDDDAALRQLLPLGSTQRRSTRTSSVYKPWKPVQEPFAELLATTSGNKKIRQQLEEEEETSKMAVINPNSSVEVVDVGMSVKERLKQWEPSSTPNIDIQTTSGIENQNSLDVNTNASGMVCADDDDDMDGDSQAKDSTTVHSEDASNRSFTTTSTIGVTNVSTTVRSLPQRSISKVATLQVDLHAKNNTNGHENSHESDEHEEEEELDLIANLETMFMEESATLAAPEPDVKGYSRYRTKSKGKNKQRPWRDDTNVFDAY